MAFNDWTGNLIDAPCDVIDAAIQKALNGAPVPDISPMYALSQVIIDEHPEYRSEYMDLFTLYVNEFGESEHLDLNEYGFSTWESCHPVINALHLVYNKFHWYHMKSIVKRIDRDVRIQELDSGKRFDPKDRLELIAAKAYEEQEYEGRRAVREWRDNLIAVTNRRSRESTRELVNTIDKLTQPQQSNGSLVDWFLGYNSRNPLTVGIIGASIYHKLKDAFVSK